jgi:hypothetical protein
MLLCIYWVLYCCFLAPVLHLRMPCTRLSSLYQFFIRPDSMPNHNFSASSPCCCPAFDACVQDAVNDLVGQLATAVKISLQRLKLSDPATYAKAPLVPLTGFSQLAQPLGPICVLWVSRSCAAAARQMATRAKVERQILASGVYIVYHMCCEVCYSSVSCCA